MQNQPSDADQAEARRTGRARRWLMRLLLLMAVAIGSLVAWTTVERRGMERRLAALRDAGKPAAPADLNSPPVADDVNAVVEMRAAGKMIDRKADSWKAVDRINSLRLPFTAHEIAVLRESVAPNAAALPLVDAAVRKPAVGWGMSFQSPMLGVLLPDLMELRELANLLRYDALVAHVEGDDARALRRAQQILFLSRGVEHQPTILGHLVAAGIAALASDLVSDLAPDLRMGNGARDAGEAEVRELVRQLLDESDSRAGMLRGLEADRVVAADAMRALAEGRFGPAGPAGGVPPLATLKPLVYRNASASVDHFNALIDTAAATSDWPTFRDAFGAKPTPLRRSPRLYLLANMVVPAGDSYVRQHYRVLAERRLAATVLAIKLHRHRSGGAFPSELQQLVPDLLPAVPTDPIAGGGRPVGYVADPARPRVYHVGENGVDDGGTPVDETKSRRETDRVSDHVVDLLRQPKPPEPEADPEDMEVEGTAADDI